MHISHVFHQGQSITSVGLNRGPGDHSVGSGFVTTSRLDPRLFLSVQGCQMDWQGRLLLTLTLSILFYVLLPIILSILLFLIHSILLFIIL